MATYTGIHTEISSANNLPLKLIYCIYSSIKSQQKIFKNATAAHPEQQWIVLCYETIIPIYTISNLLCYHFCLRMVVFIYVIFSSVGRPWI